MIKDWSDLSGVADEMNSRFRGDLKFSIGSAVYFVHSYSTNIKKNSVAVVKDRQGDYYGLMIKGEYFEAVPAYYLKRRLNQEGR